MNPQDILKYGHLTITRTLNDFPEAEWETGGVCGVWSTKGVIAHLASYEHLLCDILMSLTGIAGENATLQRFQALGPLEFNDAEVADRQGLSPAETLADYERTCDRAQQLAAQLPADIWPQTGTLPWYGAEYSLDDFIVYTFYGHKREHAAQVAVFLDQLKNSPK